MFARMPVSIVPAATGSLVASFTAAYADSLSSSSNATAPRSRSKLVPAARVAVADQRFDPAARLERHFGPAVENLRPRQRQLEIEPLGRGLVGKAAGPLDQAAKHARDRSSSRAQDSTRSAARSMSPA